VHLSAWERTGRVVTTVAQPYARAVESEPTDQALLADYASEHQIDLEEFHDAVAMLEDEAVIEPAPELAKRVLWRLGVGQGMDEALRISVDEVLEEGRRNSL
jgi:hypothetical protein